MFKNDGFDRDDYPRGTRVEMLDNMDDPRGIPAGTRGTVRRVDSLGTMHVEWDNGRKLGLVPGDLFRVLEMGPR